MPRIGPSAGVAEGAAGAAPERNDAVGEAAGLGVGKEQRIGEHVEAAWGSGAGEAEPLVEPDEPCGRPGFRLELRLEPLPPPGIQRRDPGEECGEGEELLQT